MPVSVLETVLASRRAGTATEEGCGRFLSGHPNGRSPQGRQEEPQAQPPAPAQSRPRAIQCAPPVHRTAHRLASPRAPETRHRRTPRSARVYVRHGQHPERDEPGVCLARPRVWAAAVSVLRSATTGRDPTEVGSTVGNGVLLPFPDPLSSAAGEPNGMRRTRSLNTKIRGRSSAPPGRSCDDNPGSSFSAAQRMVGGWEDGSTVARGEHGEAQPRQHPPRLRITEAGAGETRRRPRRHDRSARPRRESC